MMVDVQRECCVIGGMWRKFCVIDCCVVRSEVCRKFCVMIGV